MIKQLLRNIFPRRLSKVTKSQVVIETIIVVLFFAIFFFTMAMSNIRPYNYINISLYVSQIVLILIWCFKYDELQINYYFVFIVILNVLIAISGLVNNGQPLIYQTMIFVPGSSFVFFQFLRYEYNRKLALVAFEGAFLLFLAIFTFIYFDDIINMQVDRIGTFFNDQNLIGYVLTYGFLITLDFNVRNRLYPLLIINLYTLFLVFSTGSRSSLIIIIVALIYYLYLFFWKKNKSIIILSALIIVIASIVLLTLPAFAEFRDRLLGAVTQVFFGYGGDLSSQYRIQYIYDGIEFSLRRMVFGYGAVEAAIITSMHGAGTHNNILDMWLNYGIIFAAMFEFFLFFTFFKIAKIKSRDTILFLSLFLAIILVQFFFPNYWTKTEYLIYPFAIGLVFPFCSRITIKYDGERKRFIITRVYAEHNEAMSEIGGLVKR